MERAFREYAKWKSENLPADLKEELLCMSKDDEEIIDRFCKDIVFGTSGLRGKMGVGTNRINSVVLRKATRGIAQYLTERYEKPRVVIGYDTRINSREYAESVADDFAEAGVSAVLFCEPTPVPVVSFAIRHMGVNGGIMITASHNPREYNGYKVYDHFGNQIDNNKARQIEIYIRNQNPFAALDNTERANIETVGSGIKEAYLDALKTNRLWWTDDEEIREKVSELSVCYTALHGAGISYVPRVLEDIGINDLNIVSSQSIKDGSFPTCHSPNPENIAAFGEALELCRENQNRCDIILATDPDSDRLGVMIKTGESYLHLSGNQVGELMLDYIIRCHRRGIGGRNLSGDKVVFKSHVSSPLVERIASEYGVEVRNVFTGFKNIVLGIEKLKAAGKDEAFLFGFEESLGYLYGDYTRDKDGIMAAQMLCLMAAEQKALGRTLADSLNDIYEKYGFIESVSEAVVFKSEKDRAIIDGIIEALFEGSLKQYETHLYKIKKEICYRGQKMYCAELYGGHRIIIRPSGTELKLKIYIFAMGETGDEAIDNAAGLARWVRDALEDK